MIHFNMYCVIRSEYSEKLSYILVSSYTGLSVQEVQQQGVFAMVRKLG